MTSQLNVAGMGGVVGIDYASLPTFFSAFGVPVECWHDYIDKLNIINSVASKNWNSDIERGRKK